MNYKIQDFLASFISLFIAMNVLGILPIYLSLANGINKKERTKEINIAILTAFLITFSFIILGKFIFRLVGITISDFLIAGGLVLIILAILMLLETMYTKEYQTKTFGVVPLGTPLLAGPGLLTTAFAMVSLYGYLIVGTSLVLNLALVWIILIYSNKIVEFLGNEGINGISKIASLLLASLGIMMIRKGITEILKIIR